MYVGGGGLDSAVGGVGETVCCFWLFRIFDECVGAGAFLFGFLFFKMEFLDSCRSPSLDSGSL